MPITPPMHVFRNNTSKTATPNNFLRQSKPNVGAHAWLPNNKNLQHRTQPWERGATFFNVGRSGTAAVGSPNDRASTSPAEWIGQQGSTSPENDKRIAHMFHEGARAQRNSGAAAMIQGSPLQSRTQRAVVRRMVR